MLGDHQADFAGFLLGFVSRLDHLDPVLLIKRPRLAVQDIGQVSQVIFGVGYWRVDRTARRQALKAGRSRLLQGLHRLPAQRIELRRWHKPRAGQRHLYLDGLKDRFAQLAQGRLQLVGRIASRLGRLPGQGELGACAETGLVGQAQMQALAAFLQPKPNADPPVGRFLFKGSHPAHVAVAVDQGALAQVFEAAQRVLGVELPLPLGAGWFCAIDL